MKHRAKKSLSQNFLKSQSALEKITKAGDLSPEDTVLEIGPGLGALTEKLLERAGKVVAVEKDRELFVRLQEKFAPEISTGKLELVEEDILNFEPEKSLPKKYKLVANIPYNITGAILRKFLAEKKATDRKKESGAGRRGPDRSHRPSLMVLLVQKEVAERIIARDGKESILSISVKAYGAPKIIARVPAGSFSPAPKVDSAILAIENISEKFFCKNKIGEGDFWMLIKTAFAHKRKKLSGNLSGKFAGRVVNLPPLPTKFKDKRAEDLSLADWTSFFTQKASK